MLLIDYEMPHKNGLEVIQELRVSHPDLKILMITSHTEPVLIQQLHKYQIRHLVVKPFDKQKIREKLAKLLDREDFLPKVATVQKKAALNLSELQIPSIPSVINKVLLFNVDKIENGSVELEQLISPDRAISAMVIRIANSAYYGRSGKIKTIRDAITLIGVKNVRNIIVVQHVRSAPKALKNTKLTTHLLEIPILTALIGLELAATAGVKSIKEEVFLHALLYRIGMNVLALNFSERYLGVLKAYEEGVKSIYDLEQKEFDINSVDLGCKIFEMWKMPEDFIRTIRNQKFHKDTLSSVTDIDRILKLAELLAQNMKNQLGNPLELELMQAIFQHYNISEDIQEIYSEEYYEIVKEHPFFELMVG
ncbi:MAG: HDOD domain-containing protein [Spirochaetota bacterium]